MTHEAYMPIATEASLVAGGAGFVLWALLHRRGARPAVVAGAGGFLLLGIAVAVRYTDVLVLAVIAAAAAVAVWRRWSPLRARWLALWAAAGALGPAFVLVYNDMVYGGPLHTGYTRGVTFSLGAVLGNLRTMPRPLLLGMPLAVLAAGGVAWAIVMATRRRVPSAATTSPTPLATNAASDPTLPMPPGVARRDLGVALFCLGWWLAVWLTYLSYDWTTVVRPSMHFALTSRFYVPALGALTLLGAYLLTRIPVRSALLVACAALCFGATMSACAVTGDWLYGHSDAPVVPQPGMLPGGAPIPGTDGGPGGPPGPDAVPDGPPGEAPPDGTGPGAPPGPEAPPP
jgi:hypothetical protein